MLNEIMKISRFILVIAISITLILACGLWRIYTSHTDEGIDANIEAGPADVGNGREAAADASFPQSVSAPESKQPELNADLSGNEGAIDISPVKTSEIEGEITSEPLENIISGTRALLLGAPCLVAAENTIFMLQPRKGPGNIICTNGIFQGKIAKGDTISKVLENTAGTPAQHYVSAAQKVFSLKSFREGQPFVVVTDPATGTVKRFEYEINDSRRLVVEGIEKPQARLENIKYTVLLDVAEGAIDDNLFQAVADIGEKPQLALKLVELFGSEINFIRDLQEGDTFSALIEKRYRDGEYKGYGRILAATFTNRGKKYEAYLFRDSGDKAQYYNRKGENLHKTLLQMPLAFTRITSRFTHQRKHPILGGTRPHLGVDYGAPTGTPVKAVGDGVVTARGWAGGYGNQIIIRHTAGLESMYAHLSGFSRGLKTGQRVRQGQVIGFVGSTGLSTGPHLDFRLRQNGNFINPAKAINPRGAPVSARNMKEFMNIAARGRSYLEGDRPLTQYNVDSMVPLVVSFNRESSAPEPEAKKDARKSRTRLSKTPPKSRASGEKKGARVDKRKRKAKKRS